MSATARRDAAPRLGRAGGLVLRVVWLYFGLGGFGLSLALLVRARVGLDPWDVLHQGIARHLGVPIGWVVIGVSCVVLAAWIPLRQRPGFGTLSNAVVVGLVVNISLGVIPSPGALLPRVAMLGAAIVVNGLATGFYIGAGLGPGPRDGLMTGLAARGRSIRVVRTVLEVSVLVVGVAVGGSVGIGTLVYAVTIGPLVHFFLPRLTLAAPPPRTSNNQKRANVKPLIFGMNVSTSVAADADPVRDAQAAERLGFDFVSASDHPCGTHPTYETWTMLTWIAAATSRIRVATRVLGVPVRSPALVAKMAESLDRLSGGRLILGLGAGASDPELHAFGIPVPSSVREKIEGLDEALQVIRGLWSQPTYSYPGHIHHTNAAELEPKPAHRIPIWLGTFGDRALAVTGRSADGWIPSLGYAPAENLPAMRARVLAAAHAAGRAPDELTCALNVVVHVGDNADLDSGVIAGNPDQIAATLHGFVDVGFTAFNFMPTGTATCEQIERIASEVIPALRAMGDTTAH